MGVQGWGGGVKDQYGIISHECERYAEDWVMSRDGVTAITVVTVAAGHSPTHDPLSLFPLVSAVFL